jgi:hypothetical protein
MLLILSMALLSCDPGVDIENISPGKLLAVSCFIGPQDTVFTAYVFRGSPMRSTVNTDSAAVKDALVTISDGLSFDTLYLTYVIHPNNGRKRYRYEGKKKNVTVTTNSTYFLDVQTSSGDHVTSSCVIPPIAGIPIIDGVRENDGYKFSVSWDNPRLYEYFTLLLDAEGTYEITTPAGTFTYDIRAYFSTPVDFPSNAQAGSNLYEGIVFNAYRAENPLLRVTVRHIDEDTYRYFKSFQRYEQWNTNNTGNVFPNLQELPMIYSNIQGGAGIFGGYNQSTVEVKL